MAITNPADGPIPTEVSPAINVGVNPQSSRAIAAVVIAQFLSVLADNAILFIAIASLRNHHYADWAIPTLQQLFIASFILLAPFSGPLADAVPKARVMQLSNALKLLGALLMLIGVNELFAYMIIGIGAAIYSTAKYAILCDIVISEKLVKTNGMLESTAIAAILTGAIAGGVLADISITIALSCACATYVASACATTFIPKISVADRLRVRSFAEMIRDFSESVGLLYGNKNTRFAIIGTSLFWGTGGLLRFILVAWVPTILLITTNKEPAMLNAMVALGIALGAIVSSRYITITTINRALPAGIGIGVLLVTLMLVDSAWVAAFVLLAIGICGGIFMIPLDALLQSSGQAVIGTGRTIAVQGFFKNIMVAVMLSIYMLLLKLGVGVVHTTLGLGIALTAIMSFVAVARVRNSAMS